MLRLVPVIYALLVSAAVGLLALVPAAIIAAALGAGETIMIVVPWSVWLIVAGYTARALARNFEN